MGNNLRVNLVESICASVNEINDAIDRAGPHDPKGRLGGLGIIFKAVQLAIQRDRIEPLYNACHDFVANEMARETSQN